MEIFCYKTSSGGRVWEVTLGNVIDPTQIIKKTLLSPKLLPSDNSIQVPSNWSNVKFTFENWIEKQ